MTREEKIEILENEKAYMLSHGGDRQAIALDAAIKALQHEPCEDCVSRQEVEEMIKAEMPERGMWEIEGDKEKETVCEVCVDLIQKLSDLPPVTPQPKMGQWLSCAEDNGETVRWVCSSCRDVKSITKNKTEYCSAYGARMGMTDRKIVDKLTELTAGSIGNLDLNDAMDLLCEIKRILSRRDRSE